MYFVLLSFLISCFISTVSSAQYTAALCLKYERCTKGQKVVNDCNWCKCIGGKFLCQSRVCANVDMFGHFNDAIQDIKVGMEGHGVWRSEETPCQPEVRYIRENIMCICDVMGYWPNPICRDTFRVFFDVKFTGLQKIETTHKCTPRNLYQVGCNTCFCPENGTLDSNLCTAKKCIGDDPILKDYKPDYLKQEDERIDEIYSECDPQKVYTMGCRECNCLPNNRLQCQKCKKTEPNRCSSKIPGEIFQSDCNFCFCDHNGFEYCTVRKCIFGVLRNSLEPKLVGIPDPDNKAIEPVYDFTDCTPGTYFEIGCKTCFCMNNTNNTIIVGCNLQKCNMINPLNSIEEQCVQDTMYKKDCLICVCKKTGGILWETCKLHQKCVRKRLLANIKNVEDLPGYCEPLHRYKNECNKCKCLTNGKIMSCTSKFCNNDVTKSNLLGDSSNDTIVDIVPIVPKVKRACPKGKSYKIKCNFCFCMDNGNSLCSMKKCEE